MTIIGRFVLVYTKVAQVATGMSFTGAMPSLKGKTSHVYPVLSTRAQLEPAQDVSAIESISL